MNWIALAFIAAGTVVRFLPHPMNMTPIVALALFAGRTVSTRTALILTLGTMLVGDIAMGWVPQNLMGYISLSIAVFLGAVLRRKHSTAWSGILGAGTASSVIFFILSNFGVWLEGRIYPMTWIGLIDCYVAGVPFFRNQIVGDLLYTGLLFGAFGWVTRRLRQPSPLTDGSLMR